MARRNVKVVVDDGRRYLERTREKYDVVVIDPPPPIPAAGSSLLYSKDFYNVVKEHLTQTGIFQIWFPGNPSPTLAAAVHAMVEVFPYVKAYKSIEDWGYHCLMSKSPIENPTADMLRERMPLPNCDDLTEWSKVSDKERANAAIDGIVTVLAREVPLSSLYSKNGPVISDDSPFNEYFLIREVKAWLDSHMKKRLHL